MRFLLLSDLHATSKNPFSRKDEILDAFLSKMEFVLEYAEKKNATILQAGDFFNRPRDWLLLYLMMKLLDKFYKTKVFTIYGQHDQYMYSDITASPTTMSILSESKHFEKLGRKPVKINGVSVYGCDWGSTAPKPKGNKNVLVIHASIAAKELFLKHDFTSPAHFIAKNRGYDLILCGDIHRHMLHIGRQSIIVNTGPMLRLEGSTYNMKHEPCFYVWNSKNSFLRKVKIPHEKASKILTREHIIRAKDFKQSLEIFSSAIKNTTINFVSIKSSVLELSRKLKANKRVKKFLAEVMEED